MLIGDFFCRVIHRVSFVCSFSDIKKDMGLTHSRWSYRQRLSQTSGRTKNFPVTIQLPFFVINGN
jgi:hypothetical protein